MAGFWIIKSKANFMANRPNSLEQEKIWIEKSKKDIRHFEPLYNKYFDPLFRYFLRRTDDEALAQDLCSATFYKSLDNLKRYQWQGKPFGAWLFKIAGNELKKHFRDRKPVYVIDAEKLSCLDAEIELIDLDYQEELIAILDELPEKDLRILELKYFENYNFREISELLEIGESAVKMRIYRLLGNLRTLLESHDKT
ncbi:MAG: sigma-70 family RNA polymerase sigma factor [Cytophagales bacterium]|nr:sigma-70 family RNA polymerase sigma factor [Cytophagales bacterium]